MSALQVGMRLWMLDPYQRGSPSVRRVTKVGRLWATAGNDQKIGVLACDQGYHRVDRGEYSHGYAYTDDQWVQNRIMVSLTAARRQAAEKLAAHHLCDALTLEQVVAVCVALGIPYTIPTAAEILGTKP